MKDRERLKELIKPEHSNWIGISNQKAISNLLKENENLKQAIKTNQDLYETKCNENKQLREYIVKAPNLDEMTAVQYTKIQEEAYIMGRAKEQQRAEEIINNNYIPKSLVKEKIEELKLKLKDVSKRREKAKEKEEENILWCLEIRLDEKIKTLQDLLGEE